MMQQLLTTSRQLTLGAYKHETECMYTQKHKTNMFIYRLVYLHFDFNLSVLHKGKVTVILLMYVYLCVCSQWAGAEDEGENGSSKEENEPGDHRAERQAKSQQRKHQPPEVRDQEAGGGRRPQGALRNGQKHTHKGLNNNDNKTDSSKKTYKWFPHNIFLLQYWKKTRILWFLLYTPVIVVFSDMFLQL